MLPYKTSEVYNEVGEVVSSDYAVCNTLDTLLYLSKSLITQQAAIHWIFEEPRCCLTDMCPRLLLHIP